MDGSFTDIELSDYSWDFLSIILIILIILIFYSNFIILIFYTNIKIVGSINIKFIYLEMILISVQKYIKFYFYKLLFIFY